MTLSTLLLPAPPALRSTQVRRRRRDPRSSFGPAASADPVTRAIHYLADHWQAPPSLEELAERVAGMSPAHFQRLFKSRVGISPKRFAQHLALTRAKDLLTRRRSLLDAALDTGLSGPSRLHDLFVAAEAMTPGEYKAHGRSLVIRWGVCDSPIGPALLATTDRGLCWLSFGGDEEDVEHLEHSWSAATLVRDDAAIAPAALAIFNPPATTASRRAGPLPVLLRGTNFQLQVWRALLRIPAGAVASYGDVARSINGAGRAVRAVAGACGANPVCYLIPCHRVIESTGALGGYGGGIERKRALLALEGTGEPSA